MRRIAWALVPHSQARARYSSRLTFSRARHGTRHGHRLRYRPLHMPTAKRRLARRWALRILSPEQAWGEGRRRVATSIRSALSRTRGLGFIAVPAPTAQRCSRASTQAAPPLRYAPLHISLAVRRWRLQRIPRREFKRRGARRRPRARARPSSYVPFLRAFSIAQISTLGWYSASRTPVATSSTQELDRYLLLAGLCSAGLCCLASRPSQCLSCCS